MEGRPEQKGGEWGERRPEKSEQAEGIKKRDTDWREENPEPAVSVVLTFGADGFFLVGLPCALKDV